MAFLISRKILPLIILSGLSITEALAGRLPHVAANAEEQKALPPYCAVKYNLGADTNNPKVKYWMRVLGRDNYVHIHHYCNGLVALQRIRASWDDRPTQNAHINRAVSNFNYMVVRMTPSFPLGPEAHMNMGKAYIQSGQTALALEQFNKSIAWKNNYAPAYAALSDLYADLGDMRNALDVVKRGLKQVPRSKSLLRREKKYSVNAEKNESKKPG